MTKAPSHIQVRYGSILRCDMCGCEIPISAIDKKGIEEFSRSHRKCKKLPVPTAEKPFPEYCEWLHRDEKPLEGKLKRFEGR